MNMGKMLTMLVVLLLAGCDRDGCSDYGPRVVRSDTIGDTITNHLAPTIVCWKHAP